MGDKPCTEPVPSRHLSGTRRFLSYGAGWLIAAIVFQTITKPEGVTTSDLGEIQQRLCWFFQTPLVVAMGLAEFFTGTRECSHLAFFLAVACLVIHAIITMTRRYLLSFVLMISIQAAYLVVGVISFIRFSRLPAGA